MIYIMCFNLDIMSLDDVFYMYFIIYKFIKMYMFLG